MLSRLTMLTESMQYCPDKNWGIVLGGRAIYTTRGAHILDNINQLSCKGDPVPWHIGCWAERPVRHWYGKKNVQPGARPRIQLWGAEIRGANFTEEVSRPDALVWDSHTYVGQIDVERKKYQALASFKRNLGLRALTLRKDVIESKIFIIISRLQPE